MPTIHEPSMRIRTRASECQCAQCPPERVCAWACAQGAGVEELVAGAALMLEGRLSPYLAEPGAEAVRDALWESYNP